VIGLDFIYGDMDLHGCALLFSVVFMPLVTELRCSVDVGDYYIVVSNGRVLSCVGSLCSVAGLLVLSLLLQFVVPH
jgi:hypothetical protein